MTSDDLLPELELLVRARYPAIHIVSWEEDRAVELIRNAAASQNKGLEIWSATQDWDRDARKWQETKALDALDAVRQGADKTFYVLLDFHAALEDPLVIRRLRETIHALRNSFKTLFLVGPVAKIPIELEKDLTILDLPMPGHSEIGKVLDALVREVSPKLKISLEGEIRERMVKAAMGLTLEEARNVYSKAILRDRKLDEGDIPFILFEKEQIIRKSGLLEYIHVADSFTDVGGLKRLKGWLERRGRAFTRKAREFGLPNPKGLMLLGVQGCGKSLVAKAIAAQWQFPLVRLDMGAMFSSYVGSSEANMRKAIKLAEGLSPVVLWVDEIEKGLAGAMGSGGGDNGVTQRLVGTFLTWLQEKTLPVFVVATANAIDQLPPELLRKGRFDEIFFVDLPDETARKDIWKIHLSKRRRDPAAFDLKALSRLTEGFSGAEIEQAVISAMFEAFHEERDIVATDLAAAATSTIPLSTTSAESIANLRNWAANRAVRAD